MTEVCILLVFLTHIYIYLFIYQDARFWKCEKKVTLYFTHNFLSNMFRPLLRPFSGWCYYYNNTNEQMSFAEHLCIYVFQMLFIFSGNILRLLCNLFRIYVQYTLTASLKKLIKVFSWRTPRKQRNREAYIT